MCICIIAEESKKPNRFLVVEVEENTALPNSEKPQYTVVGEVEYATEDEIVRLLRGEKSVLAGIFEPTGFGISIKDTVKVHKYGEKDVRTNHDKLKINNREALKRDDIEALKNELNDLMK